jgi:hypothetical protein
LRTGERVGFAHFAHYFAFVAAISALEIIDWHGFSLLARLNEKQDYN